MKYRVNMPLNPALARSLQVQKKWLIKAPAIERIFISVFYRIFWGCNERLPWCVRKYSSITWLISAIEMMTLNEVWLPSLILTFVSVDEILNLVNQMKAIEQHFSYYAAQGGSKFWVCGWNSKSVTIDIKMKATEQYFPVYYAAWNGWL